MKKNYFIRLLAAAVLVSPAMLKSGNHPGLCFRENKGQVSDQFFQQRTDILYSGTDGKMVFHLKRGGISYQISKVNAWREENDPAKLWILRKTPGKQPAQFSIYRLDVHWINCNTNAVVTTDSQTEGYENFYSESCPSGAIGVRSFKQVAYRNIYSDIDLVWKEQNGALKYEYLVHAGADYSSIQLAIEGADAITTGNNGELIIQTPAGNIVEDKPVVMQNHRRLEARWHVDGVIVSFDIRNVDPEKELVIDPLVRSWGTYYGGAGDDILNFVTIEPQNSVYVTGSTISLTNIATIGTHQTTYGGTGNGNFPGDGMIVKFDLNGTRLWATYFGGAGSDFVNNGACDQSGNLYVGGGTTSTNSAVMTTPGCHQPAFSGGSGSGDAFVAKFSSSGLRVWSTYYGDLFDDWAIGVCVDALGDVYACGGTWNSTGIMATPGAHQPMPGSATGLDAWLCKFSPTGTRIWSTYYGGSRNDNYHYCITDPQGNIYVTGVSTSTNPGVIATPGAHQTVFSGGGIGGGDATLVKFNSQGQRLWGTYYGGVTDDLSTNIKLDTNGDIVLCGITTSPMGIATTAAHQSSHNGSYDAFIAKFNAAGTRIWGSYYGGPSSEDWAYVGIDINNNIYLSGQTSSSSGSAIATGCSYQQQFGGGFVDCFLVRFDPSGKRTWGTYYGGAGNDLGAFVECHGSDVYLGGTTTTTVAAVMVGNSGFQSTHAGTSDCFLVKFAGCTPMVPQLPAGNLVCDGKMAVMSSSGCVTWYADAGGNNPLYSGSTFTTGPIVSDTVFYVADNSCGVNASLYPVPVIVVPNPSVMISPAAVTLCAGDAITLSVFGAGSFIWHHGGSSQTMPVSPTITASYTVTGYDTNGCSGDAMATVAVDPCTSNHEPAQQPRFSVYPNPSQGNIRVETYFCTELLLIDALGRVVLSLQPNEENNRYIEIAKPAPGVYLLTGRSANQVICKRVVIE